MGIGGKTDVHKLDHRSQFVLFHQQELTLGCSVGIIGVDCYCCGQKMRHWPFEYRILCHF
jgi:hypothetical protein